MMSRARFGSVLGSALVVGALALASGCGRSSTAEDPSLLVGRIWMDSKPEKPTDYVQGLYLLSRPSLGLFQRASSYDLHFERFDYKRDGQRIAFTFPQSGRAADVTFTVTACNTLPPFDLCLDLSANPWGGPKRYYARRAQDDEDEDTARAMRAHLRTP